MYWLSRLLNNPVELRCPCLVCLLCHTAGDDDLGELLFIELGEVISIAAEENLGHILSEALAHEGSGVLAGPESGLYWLNK